MKKLFDSKQKVVIAGLVGLLVVMAAVFTGVSSFYASHALPGTSVAGQPVGGMTREQVAESINAQIGQEEVVLEGDITPATLSLEDIGVTVDVAKTVDETFAANRGFVTRIAGLFGSRDIEPVVSVNAERLESVVDGLEGDSLRTATNGQVTFDAGQQIFVAGTSEAGSAVDINTLAGQISTAAKAMSFSPISVALVEVEPEYGTEETAAAAQQANQWLQAELELVDLDEDLHAPDVPTKASWVTFEVKDGTLVPTLDSTLVKSWVDERSALGNTAPEPRLQNVNAEGKVLSTAREGRDGYVASNGQALTDAILLTIDDVTPFKGVIEYDVQERTTEQRLIAPGAEKLVYQAAPGEKWIEVNLSNYTVVAYEGATPVQTEKMIPGAPATPSITGEHAVYAKVPIQTMRGTNADGSPYEVPDIPWILYFEGDYAIHGAYWHTVFGYDAGPRGSHGCINMSVSSAKVLYDWATVGTKVISHY